MSARYSAASTIALALAIVAGNGAAQAQTAGENPASASGPAEDQGKPREVITIYGDRVESDPGAYSVIPQATIEETRADHAAEILNTVAGVNVQMNSMQEHIISIRSPALTGGSGQGSFLLLENGVPLRAPAFGNVNGLIDTHHEIAEAIEVVRGPGSVRYGSNAVHGLVNFIDPDPGGDPGGTFTLSGNTLQRYRSDAVVNFSEAGVDYLSALSLTKDIGWRDATGVDMQKLTFRSGWGGDDWRAVATIAGVNLQQESGGYIQGPKAYEDDDLVKTNPNPEAYRDAWTARANLRFEKEFGADLLTVTPFAITQRMIFIQHFLPDQSTEKNGHDSGGLMLRYDFGPSNLRASVGADIQYADGFLREIQTRPTFTQGANVFPQGVHYDYDVTTLTAAVYGEIDWTFATDWKLLAGLRAESHAYDYTTNIPAGDYGRFRVAPSREDDFNLLTPKLGVVWSGLEAAEIYANYARGERAPQVSDQYRLQNLQTIETLDVETLDSIEIGARGRAGPVRYDVAAYAMKKENFFFRDSDGRNVPDGKTDHYGVEAALSGDLPAGFFWNASVAWSDQTYAFTRNVVSAAEDIFEGDQIDTAPEWLADAGLGWATGPFSLLLTTEYTGEYFTNAANTASYDGHLLAHLRGAYDINDTLEAFVIVRNLTDERYADRADFGFGQDRYFPGDPLNATFGVRVRR
jgi:iron complex outermembrane receptor protein